MTCDLLAAFCQSSARMAIACDRRLPSCLERRYRKTKWLCVPSFHFRRRHTRVLVHHNVHVHVHTCACEEESCHVHAHVQVHVHT